MKNFLLQELSTEYRLKILEHIFKAKKGHIGGSLSIIDFLTLLYHGHFVDHAIKKKVNLISDNTCILSKGHCAIAQYVILNKLGYISDKIINSFNQNNSRVAEHPDSRIPGISLNSGSLGHALSQSMGICYQRYLKKNNKKLFVILGDGEISEGSIWEAFLSLRDFSFLRNLVIVIDNNQYMTLKKINYINFKILKNFFEDQNEINVYECDGHNFQQMAYYLNKIKKNLNLNILVLNTIKGKGISFMENKAIWHHKVPNLDEFTIAHNELKK